MKKLLIGFLLLAAMLPAATKTDQFNLSYWLYKPVSDQALLTTSSPTFAGLTLTGAVTSKSRTLSVPTTLVIAASNSKVLLADYYCDGTAVKIPIVNHKHQIDIPAFDSAAANHMNPYQVSNYIIKY